MNKIMLGFVFVGLSAGLVFARCQVCDTLGDTATEEQINGLKACGLDVNTQMNVEQLNAICNSEIQ